uniref:BPI2 domain-containing protein n=1 Tax=Syphacia muris TaxID=451379 RepID=A0A0N5AF51_9BILA
LQTIILLLVVLEAVSGSAGDSQTLPNGITNRAPVAARAAAAQTISQTRTRRVPSYSSLNVNFLDLAPDQYGQMQVMHYTGNATAHYVGEYDPALAGGVPGYPGIRVRINMRTFQWMSSIARQMIEQQLPRLPIPNMNENIPEVIKQAQSVENIFLSYFTNELKPKLQFSGTAQIYNAHVSKYRPPTNVAIYPAAPNRILVAVEDFDIGVTGNLGGQITVLLPLPLCGIIHADLYRVSARLMLSLGRDTEGSPCLLVDGCDLNIGYADVCVDDGGLVGMGINLLYRQQLSSKVKQMIPGRVCSMISPIVAQKINPRLKSIPQSVGFSQIASIAQSLLRSNVPAYCNSPYCLNRKKALKSLPIPSSIAKADNDTDAVDSESFSNPFANINSTDAMRRMHFNFIKKFKTVAHMTQKLAHHRVSRSTDVPSAVPLPASFYSNVRQVRQPAVPTQYQKPAVVTPKLQHKAVQSAAPRAHGVVPLHRAVVSRRTTTHTFVRAPRARGISVAQTAYSTDPCDSCPANDGFAMIKELLVSSLDLRKLYDLVLRLQITNAYATNYDYILDINGDFSPGGMGGVPFGPYALMFPQTSNKMVDVLISDYTINSLLYQMHKKAFLAFLVNSQTPKIGDLLKTTCGGDDGDDEDLTSAETDTSDEKSEKRRRRFWRLRHLRKLLKRNKRQADEGGLSDLGICIGDIMPEVREKYPNRTLTLFIHTARAPSVVLSARGGGMVTIDLMLLIDILVDGTNDRAGTLTVTTILDIGVQIYGTRISAVLSLRTFRLEDREGRLGLPQDALDNLANMAKEMIVKFLLKYALLFFQSVNDQFSQTMSLSIPLTNLPVRMNNPEIYILEHEILLSSDIDVSPSLFYGIMGR